jgi:hypothetical protein
MPSNPNKYINQLVQGLEQHGKYYNILSKRFHSSNVDRYVTKYVIEEVGNKENKIEVYNKLELLKYLVREWCKVTESEVPESCVEVLEGDVPRSHHKGGRKGEYRGPRKKSAIEDTFDKFKVKTREEIEKEQHKVGRPLGFKTIRRKK